MCGPARSLHRIDRALRGLRALQRRQFFFYQRRRGSLATRLDTREQIALQPVFVGHKALQVGIVGIGFGNQVEQIESAAGGAARSAVMAETMLPAAPVITNTVSSSSIRPGWPSSAAVLRADRPSRPLL